MKERRNLRSCCSLLALLLLSSCAASTKKVEIPSYGEAKKRVLAGGPLVEEPIEKRMNIQGGKQQAIKKDDKAPYTGILINNPKAEELIAIKAERAKLRKLLESSRLQLGTMKIIYEATMGRLKQEVKRTWWEKNRGIVGLVIGIVVGVGTTIGLVYALTRGNAISTTTNSRLLKSPCPNRETETLISKHPSYGLCSNKPPKTIFSSGRERIPLLQLRF